MSATEGKVTLTKAQRAARRCNNCGVFVPGMWGDNFPKGCALADEAEIGRPCRDVRIDLLQTALGRALLPDAFDERARIKPGMCLPVLDATNAALRQAAALRGPVSADFEPAGRQALAPEREGQR